MTKHDDLKYEDEKELARFFEILYQIDKRNKIKEYDIFT